MGKTELIALSRGWASHTASGSCPRLLGRASTRVLLASPAAVNHYCTYFDRGFLIQGLALWRSLAAQDAAATLWVLAFDDDTAALLGELGEPRLRVARLAELEAADPEFAAVKATRSTGEYYFTSSPCWLRWLLASHPEITRVTYLDADLLLFSPPAPVHAAMDAAKASVLLTPHRFPAWQRHYERYGKFNKGWLAVRNDAVGRACLDDWRTRCLEWCRDQPESGRYADQGYLTAWPEKLGAAVLVLDHAGVNLAPWNWLSSEVTWDAGGRPQFDGQPLVAFHFSRFRPLAGDWWWRSGQLQCGVMPWRLRQKVYGPYWRALKSARAEIAARRPGVDFPRHSPRFTRAAAGLAWWGVVFGGNWLRVGDTFVSGRLGLGRWSGRFLVMMQRIFLPRSLHPAARPTVSAGQRLNPPAS